VSPTINPTLPTAGQPRPGEEIDVLNALITIRDAINGNLDAANVAHALFGHWRTIAFAQGVCDGVAAGTYMLLSTGKEFALSGALLASEGPVLVPIVAADHTVSGLATKLRLRAILACNAAAPGITFTFGLYPVSFGSTGFSITPTLGTVVPNTTVAFASPGASTENLGVSSEIDLPADGVYVLGVNLSGTPAASTQFLAAHVQTRHV
jgi:hypothetical protein